MDIRVSNKRIRRSLKTDEYYLALEKAKSLIEELRSASKRKDIRIQEFHKKYIEWAWIQKPASARLEDYRFKWIQSYFDNLGIEYLADITTYQIEQMRLKLKEKGCAHATINRYCQLLRGMIYKAIDWEFYQGINPLKKIKFFRENPEIRSPSRDEINQIIRAAREIAKNPWSSVQKVFADMIILAINTGLRKSEVLNLKWRDIRNDVIEVIGKGQKRRTIPLNSSAQEVIERQPRQGEYIFELENRHQPDIFRRTVKRIRKMTGIPFYFHLCRHYAATTMLEKGVDIVTIGEILGHSKTMVSLLYSHTDPEKKRRAVDTLCGHSPKDV